MMNAVPESLGAPTQHRTFSILRLWALASNTLLELVRLKVFYFLLIFGLVMTGSSAFTVTFTFQQQFQVLKDVSLGSMSIFTWLLATLATAMMIPKDLEDRTLYTILAKPVPRLEYVLGKLLGVLLMLAIATLLMSLVFVIAMWSREQIAIAEAMRQYPPGVLRDEELANIAKATWNWNLIPGIVLIYLKAAICAAMTLMLSTFATSMIFTVIISVVMYIIGHLVVVAREFLLSQGAESALWSSFLGAISIVFPDFQLFSLVDDIVAGNAVSMPLFGKTLVLGGGYFGIYTLVAYLFFSSREL